jgi:hypothetical protein
MDSTPRRRSASPWQTRSPPGRASNSQGSSAMARCYHRGLGGLARHPTRPALSFGSGRGDGEVVSGRSRSDLVANDHPPVEREQPLLSLRQGSRQFLPAIRIREIQAAHGFCNLLVPLVLRKVSEIPRNGCQRDQSLVRCARVDFMAIGIDELHQGFGDRALLRRLGT